MKLKEITLRDVQDHVKVKGANFDISLKLDPDFCQMLNYLRDLYGDEISRMNGFSNDNLNFTDFIDNFLDTKVVADAVLDSTANNGSHDICTLRQDMNGPHAKLLAYNKIFYEIKKKYGLQLAQMWMLGDWNGATYLHNATTSSYTPYCFAYDLDKVAERGLFFISRFKTKAPKHLTTFNDHVLEFVGWCTNRSSGAVGLPSYLVYSWYFWNKDVKEGFYMRDPEYYRRQSFQKFIYDLNQPYLRITQSAFTNISIMDRCYLEEIFGSRVFPDGTYAIDHIEEILEHQKVFMEVVSEIREELMMTYPVLTYCLLFRDGKFVDEEFARWCSDHNCLWYDSNFYNGEDVTTLSNCCRLLSDTSKLSGFINSIGGTSLSVGSCQVNTINLRRIALEVGQNEDKYIELLKERLDVTIKTLDVIRHIIQRNIEKGLLPNYSYDIVELDKQYNTIGITAMFEVMQEFGYIDQDEFGNYSYSDKAIQFAKRIMDTINEQKDSYGFDYSLNVENIPAERANVVLANKDAIIYPEAEYYELYSNQWIPLMEKCTIQEKVRLGSILDKMCGGGQISHINLDAPFNNKEQAWKMLNYIASQGVIYFAFNTKISVCKEGHAFYGNTCPKCGQPKSDTYTRIVGFLTPVSEWSKTRRWDFDKRKWFDLNESMV